MAEGQPSLLCCLFCCHRPSGSWTGRGPRREETGFLPPTLLLPRPLAFKLPVLPLEGFSQSCQFRPSYIHRDGQLCPAPGSDGGVGGSWQRWGSGRCVLTASPEPSQKAPILPTLRSQGLEPGHETGPVQPSCPKALPGEGQGPTPGGQSSRGARPAPQDSHHGTLSWPALPWPQACVPTGGTG